MIDGNNSVMLPGNMITRSNNGTSGIEFTWSLWMQVNDVGNGMSQVRTRITKEPVLNTLLRIQVNRRPSKAKQRCT